MRCILDEQAAFEELLRHSLDFRRAYRAYALFAASELDLLSLIDQYNGATVDAMARETRTDPQGLGLLLDCLAASGILLKDADTYRLPARFRGLFHNSVVLSTMLADSARQFRLWVDAVGLLSPNRAAGDILHRFDQSEAWTAQYLRRVQNKNASSARSLVQKLRGAFRSAKSLIDIGGGHGGFALAALDANPDLQVTIYDLPSAIAFCRGNIHCLPDVGRISLETGDARQLSYENSFDIALLSDLLHYFTLDEKREVLRRSLRALTGGGLLVVSKFRLDSNGVHPEASSYFAFQKYLETPNAGSLETDAQCANLLIDCGAINVSVVALSDERTLVMGRRAT